MDKTELRRSLLHQRQALSPEQWQEQSQKICEQIQSQDLFQQSKTILVYLSHRQEPDLESLFTAYPQKLWGLPRCQVQDLVWHYWHPRLTAAAMVKSRYGIREPDANLPLVPVEEVDLILVPCVGCDRTGYRLGYGGGYYDRLLSQPLWQNKPTLGITFAFAYLEKLPINHWDIQLQGVCTEQEMSNF
jgi:5-formyltetrahydrofolate cyclo-ligase